MQDEATIRKAVRQHYAEIATGHRSGELCCGPGLISLDPAISEAGKLYAGCGSPVETAEIKEGEVVLDLGCGGGFDVFKAGRIVGPAGRVIGIDATPEMVWSARDTAKKHNATNVEFRLAEIEHIPIDSDSVDAVLSNCVINLTPDKGAVFREAFRVLKPDGRIVIADILAIQSSELSKHDLEEWAACVAGAIPEQEYTALMKKAGFTDIRVRSSPLGDEMHSCCSSTTYSATLTAKKPVHR